MLSFSAGCDRALILRYDLQKGFSCFLPLILLTDSKQMFDVVTKVLLLKNGGC